MKKPLTFIALGAGLGQVTAAHFSFRDAPSFTSPENSDSECTQDMVKGFGWNDLSLGNFDSYKGFSYSGYKCSEKFGKLDTLTGRNFQSKCITGRASSDRRNSPKMSCNKSQGIEKASIREFQVTTEFDCDLEFHYTMPDGSNCKHRASCKASGTTVNNTQCGGATEVTVVYPQQPDKPKDTCDYGIHHIGFDCEEGKPTKQGFYPNNIHLYPADADSYPVNTLYYPVGPNSYPSSTVYDAASSPSSLTSFSDSTAKSSTRYFTYPPSTIRTPVGISTIETSSAPIESGYIGSSDSATASTTSTTLPHSFPAYTLSIFSMPVDVTFTQSISVESPSAQSSSATPLSTSSVTSPNSYPVYAPSSVPGESTLAESPTAESSTFGSSDTAAVSTPSGTPAYSFPIYTLGPSDLPTKSIPRESIVFEPTSTESTSAESPSAVLVSTPSVTSPNSYPVHTASTSSVSIESTLAEPTTAESSIFGSSGMAAVSTPAATAANSYPVYTLGTSGVPTEFTPVEITPVQSSAIGRSSAAPVSDSSAISSDSVVGSSFYSTYTPGPSSVPTESTLQSTFTQSTPTRPPPAQSTTVVSTSVVSSSTIAVSKPTESKPTQSFPVDSTTFDIGSNTAVSTILESTSPQSLLAQSTLVESTTVSSSSLAAVLASVVSPTYSVTNYITTSTVSSTPIQTITSCGPDVFDCPIGYTAVTAVTVPVAATTRSITETINSPTMTSASTDSSATYTVSSPAESIYPASTPLVDASADVGSSAPYTVSQTESSYPVFTPSADTSIEVDSSAAHYTASSRTESSYLVSTLWVDTSSGTPFPAYTVWSPAQSDHPTSLPSTDANTNHSASSTFSAPAGPVKTLSCPDIVPSCLNTWMFDVGCKDNTDTACYCPDKNFVNNVFSCLYAHGESDEVISEAVGYFQGICAPFVSLNPGIVTGAATVTNMLTVTLTHIALYSTIGVTATTVVPGTNDAGETIPSSSSTVVISTVVTVPRVMFTTISATSGNSSSVAMVPGTYFAINPTSTTNDVMFPYPTGSAFTTLTTSAYVGAYPVSTFAAVSPIPTAGAAHLGRGLGFLGMAAIVVAL